MEPEISSLPRGKQKRKGKVVSEGVCLCVRVCVGAGSRTDRERLTDKKKGIANKQTKMT